MADQRDLELRRAALEQVRELQRRYDDLIPLSALSEGFVFAGRRISFGSFFSGIFRPKGMNGPAALCVVTAPPKENRPAPYEDEFDEAAGRFTYRFRDPGSPSTVALAAPEPGNATMLAALQTRRSADLLPRHRARAVQRGLACGHYRGRSAQASHAV